MATLVKSSSEMLILAINLTDYVAHVGFYRKTGEAAIRPPGPSRGVALDIADPGAGWRLVAKDGNPTIP